MAQPSLLIPPQRFSTGKLFAYSPQQGTPVEFSVTRGTTAFRTNVSGTLESVASGIARLDYRYAGALQSCPAWLIEPAATNLFLRSEEFDNASWVKNATGINTAIGTNGIESNVAVAPNGATTADRVNFNVQADSDLGLTQVFGGTVVGTTYISSIYIKGEGANIGRQVRVRIRRESGGAFVGGTTTYTLTSDWVRVLTPSATLVSGNVGIQLVLSSNDATSALIWGAQLETGSVATSYIPTAAATATRNADVISLTGASGLIGQTQGSVFIDLNIATTGTTTTPRRPISFEAATDVNSLIVNIAVDGTYQTIIGGVSRAFGLNTSNTNGRVKIAIGYSSIGFVTYVNGVLRDTYTGAWTQPTWNNIGLGCSVNTSGRQLNDHIRCAAIYKERLTNAELASLTTL